MQRPELHPAPLPARRVVDLFAAAAHRPGDSFAQPADRPHPKGVMKVAEPGYSIDEIRASELTWLGHSTVVVDLDGTRLLTDPVLRRRVWHLRREAAPAFEAVDRILGSRTHFGHLVPRSLRGVDR